MLQKLGKIEFKTIQAAFSQPAQQRRPPRLPLSSMKSLSSSHSHAYSSHAVPLLQYNSEPQNNPFYAMNSSAARFYSPHEKFNDNVPPSSNPLTSTPQRSNGAYLANNQHQALARTSSIRSYASTGNGDAPTKTKLCKTFSEPNEMRLFNLKQINSMRLASIESQENLFHRAGSTPYSQQSFLSRTPFDDPHAPDYFGKLLANRR